MPEWLVSPLAGGGIVVFGLFLLRTHVSSWNQQRADESLDEYELTFYGKRYRRRLQTTAMLVGVGAMVAVEGQIPKTPAWFAFYWLIVLLAIFWIAFQALGDLAQTKFHSRANLARIRRKQRELHDELARVRGESDSPYQSPDQ